MEGLFPILLFIIIIALVNKSSKKKSQAAVKAHRASESTPPSTAIRAAVSALPHVPNVLDMVNKAAEDDDPEDAEGTSFANGEGFSDAEGCIGGSITHAHENSFTDEAGCIGGSIPHIHEESFTDEAGCVGGSLPHGHEEGSPERVIVTADEKPAAAYQPRTWNAGDMRRAVVMSEILRAPVALRGKGDRR